MSRWVRSVLVASVTLATVFGVVYLGPPTRPHPGILTRDDLSAWCIRRYGPGGAVRVRGGWNCSHAVAGFFLLTPLEPAVVCGDMQLAVATVTSDDQRIECRA